MAQNCPDFMLFRCGLITCITDNYTTFQYLKAKDQKQVTE